MMNFDFLKEKIHNGTFIVVDFETVTPAGRPPEPMELAALTVKPNLIVDSVNVFNSLMRLPEGVFLTSFDVNQTGILQKDVDNASSQIEVFERFEQFLPEGVFLFVAQNANYEASILNRFKETCLKSSKAIFIDTIKIGKYLYPNLPNYKLNTLSSFLEIPIPVNRHRALPDVVITAKIFIKMVEHGVKEGKVNLIQDLIRIGKIADKTNNDNQLSLF